MSPMVKAPITTEHALLGFLYQEPLHGYEIYRRLSRGQGLGLVWRLRQNRLYAMLSKLEREGYVTIQLKPQESRPARKVFHLTEKGRQAFLSWVQSPVKRGRKLRLDFMAKLYFAQQQEQPILHNLIEQQRQACQAWLVEERDQAERHRDSRPFDRLIHQFRVGQIEAMLQWLDVCQIETRD